MLPQAKRSIEWKKLVAMLAVTLLAGARGVACQSVPTADAATLPSAKGPYPPITLQQRLRWFVTNTVGPAHVLGVALASAGGTGINRPFEYGPHWSGFGDRVGSGEAGSAVGNAMEGGAGFFLGEDPRYFGDARDSLGRRAENTIRLTFLARTRRGGIVPAYARYLGIVGGNFLSNTWRPRSEANVHDALLRSSEGFGGHLAANAFTEFWPDVKRRVFHTNPGQQH